jgi:hypothetical protein
VSKYKSPFSVSHRQPIIIDPKDPRSNNIDRYRSRIGSEVILAKPKDQPIGMVDSPGRAIPINYYANVTIHQTYNNLPHQLLLIRRYLESPLSIEDLAEETTTFCVLDEGGFDIDFDPIYPDQNGGNLVIYVPKIPGFSTSPTYSYTISNSANAEWLATYNVGNKWEFTFHVHGDVDISMTVI